ncbi:hypothetical protein N657DRAFT_681555 [Parathielavia appendiculata]|uniref:Uncharacterized protein n=1 Tax=Parathielavia appendiculata TaxID=2587402 RepID=A0AAN6TYM0_9PEZI|nr:hypothetical protein N657DRAFT_681555 [Parathielavia appendiculata]
MTTRNLNQTWRDVVFNQYAADYAADVPFPVRYLIHADQWNRDIFIEIPTKIDAPTFRRAILDFCVARRNQAPVYGDDRIKVRPRASPYHQSEASSQNNHDDAALQEDNEPDPSLHGDGAAGLSG